MSKYIDSEKLKAEIERRIDLICTTEGLVERDKLQEYEALRDINDFITSLQQEQPDTCIFGNTPSEEACKFCGVDCELREPKQSGITSTNLSSTNEAVGLAIMAYLDTKVKHDNAKVCGVSLRVAREWIREKIANKQEQPEVDLDAIVDEAFDRYSSVDGYGQLAVSFNRAELYSFIKKIARKED